MKKIIKKITATTLAVLVLGTGIGGNTERNVAKANSSVSITAKNTTKKNSVASVNKTSKLTKLGMAILGAIGIGGVGITYWRYKTTHNNSDGEPNQHNTTPRVEVTSAPNKSQKIVDVTFKTESEALTVNPERTINFNLSDSDDAIINKFCTNAYNVFSISFPKEKQVYLVQYSNNLKVNNTIHNYSDIPNFLRKAPEKITFVLTPNNYNYDAAFYLDYACKPFYSKVQEAEARRKAAAAAEEEEEEARRKAAAAEEEEEEEARRKAAAAAEEEEEEEARRKAAAAAAAEAEARRKAAAEAAAEAERQRQQKWWQQQQQHMQQRLTLPRQISINVSDANNFFYTPIIIYYDGINRQNLCSQFSNNVYNSATNVANYYKLKNIFMVLNNSNRPYTSNWMNVEELSNYLLISDNIHIKFFDTQPYNFNCFPIPITTPQIPQIQPQMMPPQFQPQMSMMMPQFLPQMSMSQQNNQYPQFILQSPIIPTLQSAEIDDLNEAFDPDKTKRNEVFNKVMDNPKYSEGGCTKEDANALKELQIVDHQLIGVGVFGRVYSGWKALDNSKPNVYTKVAIKIVPKNKFKKEESEALTNFNNISLYIQNLISVDERKNLFVIIQEYYNGNDLKTNRDNLKGKNQRLGTSALCSLIFQLLSGIKEIHSKGYTHRDLKLENVMLNFRGGNCKLKITDFGLTKKNHNQHHETICGTPIHMAPEMLSEGQYGKEVDIWAAGMMIFYLMKGNFLYQVENFADLQKIFRAFNPENYLKDINFYPKEIRELLIKFFQADPTKRITANDALNELEKFTKNYNINIQK